MSIDDLDSEFELDLRLTEENLDELYDNAPCGYCSCLPDGTLVKLNQTLLTWLGYSRQELVARRCLQDLLTVGARLHYETYCAPLLLLQDQVREISYQLQCRDGRRLAVLLNANLRRDARGEPLVVRVTLFDITDRRKYEQELLRAKAEAEAQRELLTVKNAELLRINAELDNFVYTASHDLKQPASNMVGLFEELKRTATFHDPDAAGMMNMFEEALRQILSTIEGMTDVVQLQRQPDQGPEDAIDLHSFTQDIVRSLQAAATADFVLDFAAVPTLRLPRTSLHSILYNLLSNALKYAQPGRRPRVLVSTTLTTGGPVLLVRDNGRGIDLHRHGEEVFQLFRRFHPEVDGSGMGLYLVRRLVQQAGGRAEVDSVVGEGTTFRLYFPEA
ncbi:PAS domain-containing sensor histidine kinase [Hymenobacter aquaticus]|uniref:histidine kinase n=1 Tax=Hymenobacter aquaticus TaxID=1867101 RepID=A0A4Z0Q623_9BACT|nr:PAS domain-containing sensor histidine kinase [Hymenobacter aquaticus]TGE25125.1 PAS domain-containing sensor histidine kinase [Hymenobacter aquaticus]